MPVNRRTSPSFRCPRKRLLATGLTVIELTVIELTVTELTVTELTITELTVTELTATTPRLAGRARPAAR